MAKTESLQRTKRATAFITMLAMLFISVISVAAYSRTAISSDDSTNGTEDATSNVYTDTILNTADIQLGPNDEIIRTDENGVINIKILRAFAVTIHNKGEETTVLIAKGTVQDALDKANITIGEGEAVTPSLSTELEEGMEISIHDSVSVSITADDETNMYDVSFGTVEQAIASAGVTLGDEDILSADRDEQVTEGMEIVIKRVTYKEETKTIVVDYDFIEEKTGSLYSGESEVKTKGVEGKAEQAVRNKYIDGELYDTEVISETVVQEPTDKVTLVGTKEKTSSSSSGSSASGYFTDSSGNQIAYASKIVGTATAYSDSEGALTATGVPVYYGGVAVNPNIIPYGSKMYIVSNDGQYVYGYATAVDTGGAMMSGSALVDLFYWSQSECYAFGRRSVTVYVL